MKQVLYISRAGLPMDATGLRIAAIGRLFNRLGYQVHYICERRIDSQIANCSFHQLKREELSDYPGIYLDELESHYEVSGNIYSYLPRHPGGKLASIKDIVELYTASRAFERIDCYCKRENPEIIVLYNDVYGITKKLIPYCKKRGIILLADVTEWYEKRENCTFAQRIVINLTDKRIRLVDKKVDGVIAISPFLYEYYRNLGVKSILIPPLMEVARLSEDVPNNAATDSDVDIIRFVYAGNLGSKDIITPFIHSIVKANHKKVKFELDLVGIDIPTLKASGCSEASERTGIFAHGRLPHQATVEIVKKADFGILFRHNQRYAKAGFSTKFSECMSLGVAMVCNKIGGTDKFVTHGIDGFVLETLEEKTLDEFLADLLLKDRDYIESLKRNAFIKAGKIFNIDHYETTFADFLGEVQGDEHKKTDK